MNTISGRIVVKESGAGIPGLLVIVYDMDPRTGPEEVIPGADPGLTGDPDGASPTGGDRIGSALTADDGSVRFTFEDSEFQIRNPTERRPDLLLMVLAPEEPGRDFRSRIMYSSPSIAQNAGRTEQFLIRLGTDLLRRFEIAVPAAGSIQVEPPKNVKERLTAREAWSSEVVDGAMAATRQRVDQHRSRFAPFRESVGPALRRALSTVPDGLHDPARFVAPGESVFAKSKAIIERGLDDFVNNPQLRTRVPIRGIVTLTEDEVSELQGQMDADGTVPAEAVTAIKERNASGSVSFFERVGPVCREITEAERECMIALSDLPPAPPNPPPVTGPNLEPVTEDDIPKFMARLLDTMTSPEEQLQVGLMPTATRASVEQNARDLRFQPSPADVPAFHDFEELQIAFEHVWQEAIHEGVLDIAESAYETIVELGGSPDIMTAPGPDALRAFLAEGNATMRASRVVRDHRGERPDSGPDSAPGGAWVSSSSDAVVRDHRDAGRTSPDKTYDGSPSERLPQLLMDLQKRLRNTYAFTTFAANRKERSVNFGILNTFRQVWTPLSYQAGPLVKSIPLAPRQSQKVVITRKWHKKRAVQEVENNLRAVREEMSSTSRTEQEIARRASAKTTFSLSNTSTAGIEGASESTTTSFTREASRSSDDIKKSFHEAVFKAAQEIKQERTTQINSEETEDLETVETTEIVNPNDETLMTIVFYELQRRYRVTERLHRVTPVVLVAQEVPAPHEIDLDWIVAHDWILKRTILDDSFLPALELVTQTAGDETALAEMRKNIEQQRKIVEELREELAIVRRGTTAQASLIERALFHGAASGGGGGGGPLGGLTAIGGLVDLGQEVVGKVSDVIFGGPAEVGNREGLESAAERAADEARDLMFRLEREVTALNALLESYVKWLKDYHNRLTEIARLQVHIMDNILYYMQAIWRYEPPDQRFFRLHNVPVPVFRPRRRRLRVDFSNPLPNTFSPMHRSLQAFGGRKVKAFRTVMECEIDPGFDLVPLSRVARLDRFRLKGNYMVFEMYESNALTDFMMDPYVDHATGQALDPSGPDQWSLDEFADYVCCLKKRLSPDEFEELRADLAAEFKRLLSDFRRDDVLVVPTDSLFIDAILGPQSVMERYKAIHRLEDAKKAQAEVRGLEMQTVLRAARMLAGELEDPDIDKKVVIQGNPGVVVGDNT